MTAPGPSFPTPYSVLHAPFTPGPEDGLGNAVDGWAPAVLRPVYGAGPTMSTEPKVVGQNRVVVDAVLLVPPGAPYGPRDRVTLAGNLFEVVGYEESTEFNPFEKHFGAAVNLRRVEG